ncbi:Gar1/Naf1 RNA binding region-domain-containing protein [Trametes elegans]|nr:Gar1/Naf1 RNA binding region-domain-containing protein [Trametes elegans]
MAAAFSFAVPSAIPQDLQFIHDIVGDTPAPLLSKAVEEQAHSDHDHGTDSDTDSEKEVEADILGGAEDEEEDMSREKGRSRAPPSESTSDSESSSDSDSESEENTAAEARKSAAKKVEADVDDEDEGEGAGPSVRTKNEVVDVDIMIPDITEVGPHDELEKVGEVMSIVDKVVIVKGTPSDFANRGSERALDSDTLLVFDDRKVLGYIFETFGPTSEPLYQIRFNQKYPLDAEKVKLGRTVYHVPHRSNYVFVRQLRQFKGSDASNVHDEEPADDELEFSDDEQEAAHKRAVAQRFSRARSLGASSRQSTPLPSRMRDQDMVDDPYGGSSYEQSLSYNDMDFGAGPSRPAPIPYDDPYSDSYGAAPTLTADAAEGSLPPTPDIPVDASRGSGRGRGRGGPGRGGAQRREDLGRGRGRGRRQNDRGRGRGRGRGGDFRSPADGRTGWQGGRPDEYDPRGPRPPSPASLAIARATGQYAEGPPLQPDMQGQQNGGGVSGWGYAGQPMQSYDFSFGYQYPQVQPHINPRFASNFGMAGMGMGMGFAYGGQPGTYSQDSTGYNVGGHYPGGGWGDEWSQSYQGAPRQGQGDDSNKG